MRHSLKVGFSFGITSGIITTLGLIIGLNAGTHSLGVIIGGVITIAIADAFSDALGIHVSEESENIHTTREIWESTIATFLSKFIFALTFLVPLLLLKLDLAILVSLIWGFSSLSILSYWIARSEKNSKSWQVVLEHLVIGLVVVFVTNLVGNFVSTIFI